jgi:CHAT domain-containing protein
MNSQAPSIDLDELVAGLRAIDDPEARARLLDRERDPSSIRRIAERLKDEADSDSYLGTSSWSGDIVALGTRAGMPTVVALGRMAEALTLFYQDRIPEALTVFDEASGIFRAHGDEVGWARTQIGRTAPCAMLGRFDEALERAQEARAILEAAGEHAYLVRIDMNLSLLLERMNRPIEALGYSERALAAYRGAAPSHYAMHTLQNHALLLWRIGRVREAIESYQAARAGYLALGSPTDAARQDLHLGAAYLALGRYAEAVHALIAARRDLGAADAGYLAACAGMSLAECFVRLGRFHEAINVATASGEAFRLCKTTLEGVQTLIWKALAYSGLHDQETALGALESAADLLASDAGLASYQATLDVSRAQLLLETGRVADAGMLLARAIPALRQAGLSVETATAQAFWGETLVEDQQFTEAVSVTDEILAVADREGLDWLAARALHLRAQVALRRGDDTNSWKALTAATRRLDNVHRHIAWDDRVTSAGASIRIYRDAMALALRRGDPVMALHYAERSKARALADHLQAGIDVRPHARDQRSAALIAELEELRERYAWLGSARSAPSEAAAPLAALRWAAAPVEEPKRVELARIEQRRAAIWRELQVSNPAYRGEAALRLLDEAEGDLDESAAQAWIGSLHAALGRRNDSALLEYSALGDDLLLFVVRAGAVRVARLPGADREVRRLVPLLRLNIESSAVAAGYGGGAMPARAANMRSVLRRLYAVLLAPAAALLEGAGSLIIVPHGSAHHVPFHALHDGGQYLIERAEIAYAPCATLIDLFDQRYLHLSALRDSPRQGALALAYASDGTLPHVGREGQAVVGALGGRLLVKEQATSGALRAGAGECTVLHFATHGVFRPDEPLFSALHLYDGPLSTMDVFSLDLSCSLVTLSACETALGMAGAGDELMGLSRAFLYAGAASLVPSLWRVEDRSTSELMAVFYTILRQGTGKAQALRQAQLALLHNTIDAGSDYSAPFFWAPFQLIGHTGPL